MTGMLVADCVNKCREDASWVGEMAKNGFQGFANMTDNELAQAATDAGLDAKDEIAGECVRILGKQSHVPAVLPMP